MRLPPVLAKLLYKGAAVSAEDKYAAERAKLPESRIGNVVVHGSAAFVNDVTDALTQLQRSYPYGYSLVQRTTPEGRLPFPPNRFAANLVRHAVVWRKQQGFGLTRSRKSQLQSLNRELHAMRLLKCDQKYFHRPTNLIFNLERQEI